MVNCHILLVTFPGQGHINPTLQFAKRLLHMGTKITFFTSLSAIRRMSKSSSPLIQAIDFAPFSDGYDNGWSGAGDVQQFISSLRTSGSEALRKLIMAKENEGHPIKRLVYTTLASWAGQVADQLQIPSTLLWSQPATIFDIYYFHFNGCVDLTGKTEEIELPIPGLPLLSPLDLPSFMLSSSPAVYNFALPIFREHFEILDRAGTKQKVLVNTFDSLEFEPLRALKKYDLLGIGPLIPSAFLDGKDPNDTSFGGDMIQKSSDNYINWLNSKEKSSVIYVAFGSFSQVSKYQMEEIAKGLIETGKPFLWVIRASEKREKLENTISCKQDLTKQGMIVQWCSQMEVLSHSSVGCFVTHCGWNSTLESLVSGLPVVGFPQWTDQLTNAKLLQDYWKTGLRVHATADNGGTVMADELVRCLGIVMGGGQKGEGMRKQAQKWKILAKEAVAEGGSSTVNLKVFVDEIVGGLHGSGEDATKKSSLA